MLWSNEGAAAGPRKHRSQLAWGAVAAVRLLFPSQTMRPLKPTLCSDSETQVLEMGPEPSLLGHSYETPVPDGRSRPYPLCDFSHVRGKMGCTLGLWLQPLRSVLTGLRCEAPSLGLVRGPIVCVAGCGGCFFPAFPSAPLPNSEGLWTCPTLLPDAHRRERCALLPLPIFNRDKDIPLCPF